MIASLAATHSKEIWYLMRGTGLVALLIFTFTLTAGIAGVRRWSTTSWPRTVVAFLHRNLALLGIVLLAVHITTAMIDPYVSIGWLAAIVPFVSHWKTFWVGLGALALDIILALVVTSLLRAHLGRRVWRTVHWLAYACWPLAVVHGFESGTDSSTIWARSVYILAILAVGGAVIWRLRPAPPTIPPDLGVPLSPSSTTPVRHRRPLVTALSSEVDG